MSSTIQMNTSVQSFRRAQETSPVDTIDRHDFAIQKNRKPASTGGGRAWSEDEEVYLLQTRLQKMPYKHIAAHLKKTELACRLHYHQLSHGSNRRKRTNSTASSSSTSSHRASTTPPPTYLSYSPSQATIHAPPPFTSPQLSHPIAILPKPSPPRQVTSPALRLDCSTPPPNASESNATSIDKARLLALYASHKPAFWAAIAAEYGAGISASVLEDAWKSLVVSNAPPTPATSPATQVTCAGDAYGLQRRCSVAGSVASVAQLPTPVEAERKTSISALLGIDASPRSLKERELIRRIEEGIVGCGLSVAWVCELVGGDVG